MAWRSPSSVSYTHLDVYKRQRQLLGGGVEVDDGRAGALQIRQIIEIIDQHVALLDFPGRDRCHDDGIGIEIAVFGDEMCIRDRFSLKPVPRA